MSEREAIDLGPVEAFETGAFRLVRAGRREIGVIRLPGDRVYAVANRCPHRGAAICTGVVGGTLLPSHPDRLVYGMADEVIRCPWHGYEFSLRTGDCLFTGGRLRLRTYEVELRDGRVTLLGVPAGDATMETEGGAS